MKNANFPVAEFKKTLQQNPHWSSWTCFCEVIAGRKNISKRIIRRYFDKLVDKGDYLKSEKYQLLKYLFELQASQGKKHRSFPNKNF